MGQKRKQPVETLESILARPWCYYCDKDFDDLRILVTHQKQKHFQCVMPSCHRKLNTAGGLRVHLSQVHKEEIGEVPNAIEGRRDANMEVFAMEGIPQELIDARTAYVTREYRKMETEFYQKTGNPLPGTGGHQTAKRPKKETKEEMLARLAAHKAKRAAEKASLAPGGSVPSNGTNSAAGTPSTFPQHTPTPPSVAGYGGPPPMGSMPMYAHASVAPAGSPGPPNMPQPGERWRYDQGRTGQPQSYPGMPSSSPPPGVPALNQLGGPYFSSIPGGTAHSSLPPIPPPGAQGAVFSPMPAGLPPHAPPPSHQNTNKPPSHTIPSSLPLRPMSAGKTSAPFNIPSSVQPNPEHPTHDDIESLLDWAQGNVARARDEDTTMSEPESSAAAQAGNINGEGKTPEVRETSRPPKEIKKLREQGSAAEKSGPTSGSRTLQLLHNDVDSFEEMKASLSSRYHVTSPSTTIPTDMATQGATGPVDDVVVEY